MPVYLDDNDDAWFESSLVIQLLDSSQAGEHGIRALLPKISPEYFAIRKLEIIADGMTDAGVQIFLEKQRNDAEISHSWIARQQGKIDRGLAHFDQVVTDLRHSENPVDHPDNFLYFYGFSVADIAIVCFLEWYALRLDPEWARRYPTLANYAKAIGEHQSFVDTRPQAV